MRETSALIEQMKKAREHRRRLFRGGATTVYRLLNGPGDGLPGVVLDRYGDFGVARPAAKGLGASKLGIFRAAMEIFGLEGIYEKGPPEKGFHPDGREKDRPVLGKAAPEALPVMEGTMRLEARLNEGPRTGVYPDQRENRKLLAPLVQGCRVLNTFSYTGALSVSAALSGATETVSVDLSKRALEWSKRNFALNGIPLDGHLHVKADVFDYLNLARRKGFLFDLAILDPVTFSTSKQGTFRAVKDWPRLIAGAMRVLKKAGWLALSCNTKQLGEGKLRKFVEQAEREEGRLCRVEAVHGLPPDFPVDRSIPGMDTLKFMLVRIR